MTNKSDDGVAELDELITDGTSTEKEPTSDDLEAEDSNVVFIEPETGLPEVPTEAPPAGQYITTHSTLGHKFACECGAKWYDQGDEDRTCPRCKRARPEKFTAKSTFIPDSTDGWSTSTETLTGWNFSPANVGGRFVAYRTDDTGTTLTVRCRDGGTVVNRVDTSLSWNPVNGSDHKLWSTAHEVTLQETCTYTGATTLDSDPLFVDYTFTLNTTEDDTTSS